MQQVIGEILPLALGIAISPVPIIAIILMLITPKARSNGLAFLFGWMAGLAVVGGIALVIANAAGLAETGGPSKAASAVKLVLGVLLLIVAERQWQGRPRQGEAAPLPKWMQALDTFTPVKSFGVAALLSGVNPKNLMLNLAAATIIAQAGLPASSQAIALLVLVLIGSIGIIVPVVVYFAGGDTARHTLDGWKAWLGVNNSTVMAVLLLVLGVVLIGKGISGMG